MSEPSGAHGHLLPCSATVCWADVVSSTLAGTQGYPSTVVPTEFIRSEEKLDDILTKLLGRVKFHEFRIKIGLIDVGEHSKASEEIDRK
jgi:hypothetical protein